MSLLGAGIAVLVLGAGLLGVGGSYALWGGTVSVSAGTVKSGYTGVTINGQVAATIAGLDATALGPGGSIAVPVTITNTGTTPVNATLTQGAVTAQTQGLADRLKLTTTPVVSAAACTTGLTGGTTARIPGFTAAVSAQSLAAGASAVLCLQLTLDADAPSSVQGGTASFSFVVNAEQKAP